MPYSASFPIPQNMQDTIANCSGGLGAVGIVGGAIGPGADLVVIAPTWVGMMVTLACQAGRSMDEQTAKKLAIAVATGAGSFIVGTKAAATLGAWLLALPTAGASLVANMAVNATLNWKFTQAFGRAVALYFLQTGEIETSDVVVKILIALVGLQFGIPSGRADLTA